VALLLVLSVALVVALLVVLGVALVLELLVALLSVLGCTWCNTFILELVVTFLVVVGAALVLVFVVALLHNRASDHGEIDNETNLSVIGVALVLELVGAALRVLGAAGGDALIVAQGLARLQNLALALVLVLGVALGRGVDTSAASGRVI
jgi:hypothetical protein